MQIKFPKGSVEIDLAFADLVKCDSYADPLEPQSDDPSHPTLPITDPIGSFFQKAHRDVDKQGTTTPTGDFDITKALLAPADSRPVIPLRKDASPVSADDWSWSASVGDGLVLEKRAAGTARQRFEDKLAEFFVDHPENLEEAQEFSASVFADMRAEILAEA